MFFIDRVKSLFVVHVVIKQLYGVCKINAVELSRSITPAQKGTDVTAAISTDSIEIKQPAWWWSWTDLFS